MAQSTSPSMSLQDGHSIHLKTHIKYEQDFPIDPSIAASSQLYHAPYGQYSPCPPQQDIQHSYSSHPGSAMYAQPRFDWSGYAGHLQHPMHGGYAVSTQTPNSPAVTHPGQVSTPSIHTPASIDKPWSHCPAFVYPDDPSTSCITLRSRNSPTKNGAFTS
jgi:transcription factor CON7